MPWVMISFEEDLPVFKGICEKPEDMLLVLQSEDDVRTTKALESYDKALRSLRENNSFLSSTQVSDMRAGWLTRTSVRIVHHKDGEALALVTQTGKRVVLYEFYQVTPNTIVNLFESGYDVDE